MANYRSSYWKTTTIAGLLTALGLASVAGLVVGFARSHVWPVHTWLGWVVATAATAGGTICTGLLLVGGLVALHRDGLERRGVPYAARKRRERIAGPGLLALRRAARWLRSSRGRSPKRLDLRPGDLVEVKCLEEILATLDDRGALDGVPFMAEMAAHCGRRTRVFRRVDKLNDWVHKTGLRRLHETVLLEQLRCDGGAHGGCQTGCHLRWKEAWLRRVGAEHPTAPCNGTGPVPARPVTLGEADLRRLAQSGEESGDTRYRCQATELTAGTSPLARADPRHYLRDLVRGNVKPGPLLVGVALACFNWIQRNRGGVRFPLYTPRASNDRPHAAPPLQPGELVRVKSKQEIEATLNSKSRNRGLWFDADMLRFCGGEHLVQKRISRVIVERTGKLIELRNPCIVLDGVTATGEYRAFNPENEFIFWRENWLERVQGNPSE